MKIDTDGDDVYTDTRAKFQPKRTRNDGGMARKAERGAEKQKCAIARAKRDGIG